MDSVSRVRRSVIMSRVHSKNTKPEMLVRRLAFSMGYRYRLHAQDLPGTPDLVFGPKRKVVFVHGCFWHRHNNCRLARLPKSREEFWIPKLEANRLRDKRNGLALGELGWKMLTIWECQLGDTEELRNRLREFLDA